MSSKLKLAIERQKRLVFTSFQKHLIMECFAFCSIRDEQAVAAVLHERFDKSLIEAVTVRRRDQATVMAAADYLLAQCYERGILVRPKPSLWERFRALFAGSQESESAPASVDPEPPLGVTKKARKAA
jgi:hypothetical protein